MAARSASAIGWSAAFPSPPDHVHQPLPLMSMPVPDLRRKLKRACQQYRGQRLRMEDTAVW